MARTFVAASSQYLSNTTLAVPSLPTSFACWFKPASIGAVQALINFTDAAGNNLRRLRIAAGGTLGAQDFNSPTSAIAETTGVLSAGTWSFCGGSFASATSRIVYLGTEKVSNTTSVTPSGLDRLIVGANATPAQFADGDMAELVVWDAALDDAEFAALAAGSSPALIRSTSLVHYYEFFGNDSPEPDRWKNRDDLTLNNAPTKAAHPRMYYPARRESVAFRTWSITGVTRDNAGNALGGCTVKRFRTTDDVLMSSTTSDGSGNFTLPGGFASSYLVAYKAGSPDVAGVTVNTIVHT
jgi:hypothetical protein